VDDFANYAVEQDLMIKLESIFAPNSIFGLDESTIQNIASETKESKTEREQSTKKMETLKLALDVLERLDRRNTVGRFSFRSLLSVPTTVEVIQLIRDSRCDDILEDSYTDNGTEDSADECIVELSPQIPAGSVEESADENTSESVTTSSLATADELDEYPEPLSTQFTNSHWHMHPFDDNHPLISPTVKQVVARIALMHPDHVSRTVQSIVMIRSNFEKMDVEQHLAYIERYKIEAESPGIEYLKRLRMECIVHCMRSGEWA